MALISLPNWVARRRASVRTKLIVAFLGIVATLVSLGSVGLSELRSARDRAVLVAMQQKQVDQYRLVRNLADQTIRIMGEYFLSVYGKEYELEAQNAANPFALILNNADWVLSDLGGIRREMRKGVIIDQDATREFVDSLDDLKSLVTLSRELRTALADGNLELAHKIYALQATPLEKRIGHQMHTLENQLSQQMRGSAVQASVAFQTSRYVLILASGGAVFLALLLGYTLSASLVRPIRQLENRVKSLGDGEFATRLTVTNRDELGDLAHNVNRASEMLNKLYNDASEKSAELEKLSKQLSKYLSPQIYASIFEGKQEVKINSSRKKLTVFFSDIAGFTEMTDRLESEELTELLNHYLTEMSQIALEHGATIDKFVGDSIMIFFGDPKTRGTQEDARACVEMAIAMRTRLKELEKSWRDAGIARPPKCRMGIHTDFCTVGNFGSNDRLDYTIIGRGVNIASRLENLAKPGEILISYETFAHIRRKIACSEVGQTDVKGLAYPIETYRVDDACLEQLIEGN